MRDRCVMLEGGLQMQLCFSDAAVAAAAAEARLLTRGVISASVLMLGKTQAL